MNEQQNDKRSVWMMIIATLIWGTIGVFRRNIDVSSGFLACSRGLLGTLFLILFVKLRGGTLWHPISRGNLIRLVVSGIVIGINWILLFEAYSHTTVAVATLCYYMEPTIVLLLSPLVFRERLTAGKLACAAVAVAGMVLVSGVIGGGPQNGSWLGVLLGLGAAVFYSAVVILNKKLRDVDAMQKTSVQMLSAGLAMLPYLLLTNGFSHERFSPEAVLLLLVVGIMHTGIAYVLYFGSIERLPVQSVALLSYIDPVSALLFSAFLLKEPLTPLNILGAVMIIGSAVLSEKS